MFKSKSKEYYPLLGLLIAADAESELLPDDLRLFSGYFWQILANLWLILASLG
jgi:hypothetical protein